MSSKDENTGKESVREKIIEKQQQALHPSEKTLAILTLALTIGFFGSSAVLMPSQQSVTGMFSGEIDIQQPEIQGITYRNQELSGAGLSLVMDTEIRNPNVVEAEVEKIDYRMKIDGQTVKRGQVEGTTVIPASDDAMVAAEYGLDFAGVPNTAEIIRQFETGERKLLVEGTVSFDVAGETVDVPFARRAVF